MAASPPEPRNPGVRYARVLQVLHWALALLFGVQIALILVLHQLQSVEMGRAVLAAHRVSGLCVLILVLVRLGVSPWVRAPAPLAGSPAWQTLAARAAHGLMLAALAAQPALGIVVSWSRGDLVSLVGFVRLPPLIELSTAAAAQAEMAHRWLAYGLLALVAGHLAAVVFNRMVRRVAVMERMLPPITATRLVNRMSVGVQLTLACGAILVLTMGAGLYGAGQYRAFKDLQTRFDDTEVAIFDELRDAQVAQLDVSAQLSRAASPPTLDAAAKESAATVTDLAHRLKDADARAAAQSAAAAVARIAAGERSVGVAELADAQLQAAVDSQSARVLQGRLEIAQIAARGHDLIILTLAPTLTIAGILAFLLSRSILSALAGMRRVVQAVERGETAAAVEIVGGGDFARLMGDIDRMRHAVEVRERDAGDDRQRRQADADALSHEQAEREAARRRADRQASIVDELGQGLAALAKGDLGHRLERPFDGGYDRVRLDFNEAISSLEALVSQIAATAEGVDVSSDEVAHQAAELAQRTKRETQSLKETSAALGEITSRVELSARGAQGAAEAVNGARQDSEASRGVVTETIEAMTEIESSSKQIGQIVGVIDEIAFKTNMLALNAGIEAARAGDAGRAFGIIALEVRALAEHSAAAAAEIRVLVDRSQAKVALGSDLVARTGQALARVVDKVGEVDALLQGIAGAAADQADRLSDVNASLGQIDQIVSRNAAMVLEATANAEDMREGAQALTRLVRRFAARPSGSTHLEEARFVRAG